MKTQTYGISSAPFYYIFEQTLSTTVYISFKGVELETIKKWFGKNYNYNSTEDSFLSACREAVQNYIEMRANGDVVMAEFPNDGRYQWNSPSETYSKIRYTEGARDIAWMEEHDKKYLAQLKLQSESKASMALQCQAIEQPIGNDIKKAEKEKLLSEFKLYDDLHYSLARRQYLFTDQASETASTHSNWSVGQSSPAFFSSLGGSIFSSSESLTTLVLDTNQKKL
jgi:hypothetical protein